jgi:ribulose kinase
MVDMAITGSARRNPAWRTSLAVATGCAAALIGVADPVAHGDTGLTGTVTADTPLYNTPIVAAPTLTVRAGTAVEIVCLTTNDPNPTTGPQGPLDGASARWRIAYSNEVGYVDTATVLVGEGKPAEPIHYSC